MKRSKSIDLLRALAVLLVLGRHMDFAPYSQGTGLAYAAHWFTFHWCRGGWVGVDLFFVLSGFLVSGLLFTEHQRYESISPMNFLIRRGLKIYPAFWVLMLFTAIAAGLAHQLALVTLLPEILFVQNYWPGIWNHTWSLAVEEHFYLTLLFLLVVISRGGKPNPFRIIPGLFAGVAILSLGLRCALATRPFENLTHLYPTHLRMDSLFCGVAISYLYHYRREEFVSWARRYRVVCLIIGLCALAPAFFFSVERSPFIYTFGLTLFYLGSGLILVAFIATGSPDNRLVSFWAYVGAHSYSIYLWHMPVRWWLIPGLSAVLGHALDWPLYCAIYLTSSIGVGIVMSTLIEFPVLKLRDRWFPSRTRAPQRL